MAKIPLVDVKASYERHRGAIDAAIREVLETTAFIQGPALREFEEAFARFCGARHAIGVGSGTAALHLVLHALGVGPGDVVAVPSHTFIATVEPVTWLGATPRFIEVDPDTGAMDPAALRAGIDGVKVVMPVHIHGRPADLAGICAVAADAGVPVVEDAAQAQGAELVNPDGTVVRAGSYTLVGCFSFYPGKNLGAFGDAGAVTTNDDDLAGRVRMLRDHGRTTKYEHVMVGYAHRMDTLQAAVLSAKLPSLDADNARRREIAAGYTARLSGVGDLRLLADPAERVSIYHHYVVRTAHRDALLKHLQANGVGAGVHYPIPVHLQPAYASLGHQRGDLPATEAFADECLSLPIYAELTDEQMERVAAEVTAYFSQAA
ncbi:MAG TPA: DegT/DnrJ/EryC1/StrS family aminotransferase [Micromonosporaceae bacterium]|nr:DegT/DnrJ/EryC1/StrS family aminotransferase [Micromonosporaceae bacterium]